jgi:LacI family transcriptional regulator
VTISDIAKKAEVSIATVSRVINGKGYVKEETRRKVEQIITENNYLPNAIARSLIKKDSTSIGLIMPGRGYPAFSEIIDSVEKKAEGMNYTVLFCNTDEDREKEHRAIRKMMEYQVKGILIMSVLNSDEETVRLLEEAESSEIPVVLIDRDFKEGIFDAVFIDNVNAVYEAVRAFLEAGHSKIGLITCPDCAKEGNTKLDGYIKCLKEYKIPIRSEYVYHGDFQQECGYLACQNFMMLSDAPTAVLVTSSTQTLGCLRYFNENNMKAGEDIGLIGFDDITTLSAIGYSLSVIERPMKEMGETAYDLMMMRVEQKGEKKRLREILLKNRLILRGSEECSHVRLEKERK